MNKCGHPGCRRPETNLLLVTSYFYRNLFMRPCRVYVVVVGHLLRWCSVMLDNEKQFQLSWCQMGWSWSARVLSMIVINGRDKWCCQPNIKLSLDVQDAEECYQDPSALILVESIIIFIFLASNPLAISHHIAFGPERVQSRMIIKCILWFFTAPFRSIN